MYLLYFIKKLFSSGFQVGFKIQKYYIYIYTKTIYTLMTKLIKNFLTLLIITKLPDIGLVTIHPEI